MTKWQQAGRKVVPVSINIAPIEFLRDDCAERLLARLRQYQVAPEWIQVEITEHIFLHHGRDFVTRALSLLREKGIKIALDDFGTGYSSLTHLRDYAVDYLKIDCQFVQKMEADPAIFAIVKVLCQLAPSFALEVVAEGIETTQQKEMLLNVGCDYGQGFLCGEAISAQEVLSLLENT
ncbi:EAL domain-containing protein [Acinetobacter sp. MD2]|uniref:EAL domain-containing protein n=1 Tax=Acinetobacter sp. MD2 TaxID=2600066 RepID=UPI002D1EAFAC|nr:EAL domain-containing protein [Acinetobacter sp. MD2]MEB3767331.1 EAL domain-containing protein [Acinetobacter sp. MD2]